MSIVNIKDVEDATIKPDTVFKTGWMNTYCSSHPTYGISLSVNVSKYPEMNTFVEFYGFNKTKSAKSGDEFVRIKFMKSYKIFNEKCEEVKPKEKEIEKLFMSNQVKLLIEVRAYKVGGKAGQTLKVIQVMVKPKEERFSECLFE